ncbi:hypothetical protein JCM8547_009315 [Rhodosporidiobolus lusitaniae]
MSSFDQSRGYSIPSGFTRQDSTSGWSANDAWSSAPPPPVASGFAQHSQQLSASPGKLDYSIIDAPASGLAGAGHGGFGGDLLANGSSEGGASGGGGGAHDDDGPWQLPRQSRVSVTLQPQLEGFILKHNVWLVMAADTGLTVERRYSDFTWLLDCLTRRYPFRLLPSLPPKRIQVSGHYLATDDLFLERRRRGLERALTALTSHPTVKHDGLLSVFLNEQADLALRRKHNPITLAEESLSHPLSSSQLSSLPSDLDARLSSLRSRLPSLVEAWTRIATTADRLAHRRLNQGAEFRKMGEALRGAMEVERDGWTPKEVEAVEREVEGVAKVVGGVGETEELSARRKLDTAVEEFKRHREVYLNLRDLFARQAVLGVDNIDKLKKRVEMNTAKLNLLNSTSPRPTTYQQDMEKYLSTVEQDQREIEQLLRRRAFVRWCMWEEVRWAFRQTSLLSTALKDYASAETTYAKQLTEQWSALADALGAADL